MPECKTISSCYAKMGKKTKVETVRMLPEEAMRRAEREGARVFDNEFANEFTPWPRSKITANIEKLKQGVKEEEDEELEEFVRLHPKIVEMAKHEKGAGALTSLFAAHDDILSGKASKEEVMKKLMHGVFAKIGKE